VSRRSKKGQVQAKVHALEYALMKATVQDDMQAQTLRDWDELGRIVATATERRGTDAAAGARWRFRHDRCLTAPDGKPESRCMALVRRYAASEAAGARSNDGLKTICADLGISYNTGRAWLKDHKNDQCDECA
jgi:hypothetical protein